MLGVYSSLFVTGTGGIGEREGNLLDEVGENFSTPLPTRSPHGLRLLILSKISSYHPGKLNSREALGKLQSAQLSVLYLTPRQLSYAKEPKGESREIHHEQKSCRGQVAEH